VLRSWIAAQRFADKLRAPKATDGFIGLLGSTARK
jgi:hypothetical protein